MLQDQFKIDFFIHFHQSFATTVPTITLTTGGRLTLAGCHVSTKLLSHSILLSRAGGENKMKKLMDRDRDREITHEFPSGAKQT